MLCPLLQVFPLSPGPRGQSAGARPIAMMLQQALGQELARARQGSPEVLGVGLRLLQALAALLSSQHGGALVLAMHRAHFLACPLLRLLSQYQVGTGPGGATAVCQGVVGTLLLRGSCAWSRRECRGVPCPCSWASSRMHMCVC